ncbi:hypothetical protein [Actinoplanes sp. L3-i22]|uniref:hypothetical protein n=1 Tax=Actinoplanes sp. L3-i22 TaxID=2836373 RepID=UPI001C773AD3|nr:hypothetical protein [Actinoplanes sp. L3-i22]BCY08178.1 hypothetical protein L3i22_032660 [Actinoplanes sp. L3-i22]
MLMHPDVMLSLANDHRRELIAEADRERLLTSARRARKIKTNSEVRGQPTRPSSAPAPAR